MDDNTDPTSEAKHPPEKNHIVFTFSYSYIFLVDSYLSHIQIVKINLRYRVSSLTAKKEVLKKLIMISY